MWPPTFDQRLMSWHRLRSQAAQHDLAGALRTINQWWWAAPWCAMSLSWQDQAEWLDPWALLSRDKFCDLARALGISYTIVLLPDWKLEDCELRELEGRDVVSVSGARYILNWSADIITGMPVGPGNPDRCVLLSQLETKLN